MPAWEHLNTISPDLLDLLARWEALRGERRYPARADIDPAAFKPHLGTVMLIAPRRGERLQFHYRLIGDLIASRAGYDLTGRTFDDLPDPAFRDFCQRLFERALALGEPISATGRRLIAGEPFYFDSLVLPLSTDGVAIDMFLAKLIYPAEMNPAGPPAAPWNWHKKEST